jgi:hypothetical protein
LYGIFAAFTSSFTPFLINDEGYALFPVFSFASRRYAETVLNPLDILLKTYITILAYRLRGGPVTMSRVEHTARKAFTTGWQGCRILLFISCPWRRSRIRASFLRITGAPSLSGIFSLDMGRESHVLERFAGGADG